MIARPVEPTEPRLLRAAVQNAASCRAPLIGRRPIPMRIVFSVVGLLVVVFVVMQLTKTQLRAIAPVAPSRPASSDPAGSDAPTPGPRTAPQQVSDEVRRALDAGMAVRASETGR